MSPGPIIVFQYFCFISQFEHEKYIITSGFTHNEFDFMVWLKNQVEPDQLRYIIVCMHSGYHTYQTIINPFEANGIFHKTTYN